MDAPGFTLGVDMGPGNSTVWTIETFHQLCFI